MNSDSIMMQSAKWLAYLEPTRFKFEHNPTAFFRKHPWQEWLPDWKLKCETQGLKGFRLLFSSHFHDYSWLLEELIKVCIARGWFANLSYEVIEVDEVENVVYWCEISADGSGDILAQSESSVHMGVAALYAFFNACGFPNWKTEDPEVTK